MHCKQFFQCFHYRLLLLQTECVSLFRFLLNIFDKVFDICFIPHILMKTGKTTQKIYKCCHVIPAKNSDAFPLWKCAVSSESHRPHVYITVSNIHVKQARFHLKKRLTSLKNTGCSLRKFRTEAAPPTLFNISQMSGHIYSLKDLSSLLPPTPKINSPKLIA